MKVFRKVFFWLALSFFLWACGLAWFIAQIPVEPAIELHVPADAIVVLTGGSGRLEYGLKLLAKGEGRKLFISGVSQGVTLDDLLRRADHDVGEALEPAAAKLIVLGRSAENTIGNAEETARWLKRENMHSIRLVTANYHMPRSIEEFEDVAPDLSIIPAPVFPDDFSLSGWWEDSDSRTLLLSEYHKFLAAKLRHLFLSFRRH